MPRLWAWCLLASLAAASVSSESSAALWEAADDPPAALRALAALQSLSVTEKSALVGALGPSMDGVVADAVPMETTCNSFVAPGGGHSLDLSSFVELAKKPKDAPLPVGLSCECGSYACRCRKDCFCSFKTAMYGGDRLFPAHGGLPGLSLPARQAPPNYKCTCDTANVGGPAISENGVMDCDCAVAQCECSRPCDCKPR